MQLRLVILLVQVYAGNTSESLLNKIRQILYLLYRQKKKIKAVILQLDEVGESITIIAIFMNSKNSKISPPHSPISKVKDKMDLRRGDAGVALSSLSIFTSGKI